MECRTCGQPNPTEARFCGSCGARLASIAELSPHSAASTPEQVERRWLFVVGLIVVVAAGIVFGLVSLVPRFDRMKTPVAATPPATRPTELDARRYLLRPDNNRIDYSWALYDPRGQWVKFTLPTKPFVIHKVLIMGKRTDFTSVSQLTYTINIRDKDFSKVLYSADYPWTNFSTDFTLVDNGIKPDLIVNDDFYVELVSHSHSVQSGETHVSLYVAIDYSVSGNANYGFSRSGEIDSAYMSSQVQQDPRYANASWIVRVDGQGGLPSSNSPPPTP